MQFVPPLFFSRPGKGEGGRRRCFSRVYGRGGLAGRRQGEWKKMCGCGKKNRERVCRYSQKYYLCTAIATIAQSVEHFIRNEKVPGSSPGRGSAKRFKFLEPLFFMALEKEVLPAFLGGRKSVGICWSLAPPPIQTLWSRRRNPERRLDSEKAAFGFLVARIFRLTACISLPFISVIME